MNTNLKNKKKLFPIFVKMVQNQLLGGGKKYASEENREWTDVICEFDPKFMLATIMKYVGRIDNKDQRSEEDLAKIACYSYLMWIKLYGGKYG